MRLAKPLLAELLGTFALVFIGADAATVLLPNETTAVALAHGFVVMTFAYAFDNDGNSHIDPALVLADYVAGDHKLRALLHGPDLRWDRPYPVLISAGLW